MSADPRTSGPAGWSTARQTVLEDSVLSPYARALKAHAVLVVAIVLATLAAAAAWISTRSPEYQADAELLVSPLTRDAPTYPGLPLVRESGDPTRTIQTAAALVDSHLAAERAAAMLDWTRDEIEAAIDVTPQGQTNIIEIIATADSPRLATTLANQFARSVLEVRRETLRETAAAAIADTRAQLRSLPEGSPTATDLERQLSQLQTLRTGGDPNLSISQLAVEPKAPLGTSRSLIMILAFVAGVVVATGTALLIETVGPGRINSEQQLVGRYPVPVLARIPKRRRLSRRQAESLREAYRSVQVQLDMRADPPRSVLITSSSRGEGKTVVAAELATTLADDGAQVIAMDADGRGRTLAAALGLADVDMASEKSADGNAIFDKSLAELLTPVSGIESLQFLDIASTAVNGRGLRATQRIRELLEAAMTTADYVIVDTPPLGEFSDALTLVNAVNDVILVSRLGATKTGDLDVARDLLARSGVSPSGLIVVGSGRHTTVHRV